MQNSSTDVDGNSFSTSDLTTYSNGTTTTALLTGHSSYYSHKESPAMELSFAAASSREKRDLLDGQQQHADYAVYEVHS